MATIAFVMLPEMGHYYAVMGVAKKLQLNGHKICFLGIVDFREMVISHGFEFISFLEKLYPEGYMKAQATGDSGEKRVGIFKMLKNEANRIRELNEYWFKDDLLKKMNEILPDLVLVDSYLPYLALVTYRYRIPTLLLSVTLPQYKESAVPPLTSIYIPKNTDSDKFRANIAWYKNFLRNYLGMRLASIFHIDINYKRLIRKLAKQSNYPLQNIYTKNTFMPGLNMPELILCPKELDFMRSNNENAIYIEPSINLNSNDDSFPWDKIDKDKPLVFCTLGSQSHQWRKSNKFFRIIIEAFKNRPQWQLVVAIGQYLNVEDFKAASSNVLVVNWAPHSEMLRRSHLMINHGGLGTIKECIYYEVPMIVIPFMRDQPGNAARVAYHGLGILLRKNKINIRNIMESIDHIMNGSSYEKKSKQLGAMFREIERKGVVVDVINDHLQSGKKSTPINFESISKYNLAKKKVLK